MTRTVDLAFATVIAISLVAAREPAGAQPAPPGRLVDIGGQRLHLHCTGSGSPTVILEAGSGDISAIWALVQPGASATTRVCSYDRAGYAWSEPGAQPRSFAQLALELHTLLAHAGERAPYVVVGQSYGGLVIRGFARDFPAEVVGAVFVDAVHEDQRVVYGGQPHRIRDGATGRVAPPPSIRGDTAVARVMRDSATAQTSAALDAPLDRLPVDAQRAWRWAMTRRLLARTVAAELDWSPEELARFHADRTVRRESLGAIPLVVLARASGGYADGMTISADSLERERRALMQDLAALSSHGRLEFVESGHNIHVEAPAVVIAAIREVVMAARAQAAGGYDSVWRTRSPESEWAHSPPTSASMTMAAGR